ncbi:ecto-NOX disulfide-thiol exchanger 2 [Bombina bombina]|uniref:ecto-NOX disulfide-thiol exchanger 2 n=1 Tax=Bombina bombina TaxID=8345 RepID=UPI00235A86E8|nr:ecto-NOX disulfide-thiol exchanger 2 [Bombina bombina]
MKMDQAQLSAVENWHGLAAPHFASDQSVHMNFYNPSESEPGKRRRRNTMHESAALCEDSMSLSIHSAWATSMANLGITMMDMRSQPEVDAGLGGMNPLMMPTHTHTPVVKEIIHYASCTLFPPSPNLPPPTTRVRPPGCKTIFVGGLPENSSEHTLREVFGQFGEILTVRRGGKSFCHIRFSDGESVERALYLSGYKIRLGSSLDRKDTGHFHVDYSQARDDQYEWECLQRAIEREERHRRRLEEQRLRPPSPPPVLAYCEHAGNVLAERLKDSTTFKDAVQTLITWMERGEVNRQSANSFYGMIQSMSSSVRRLQNETQEHKRRLEEAKEEFKCGLNTILQQFVQILCVFHAASKQRVRDHFSKAQRKNLNTWREQAQEIHRLHSADLLGIRCEEEMEMSDEEMEGTEQRKSPMKGEIDWLREENDNLARQLDVCRIELNQLKEFVSGLQKGSNLQESLSQGNGCCEHIDDGKILLESLKESNNPHISLEEEISPQESLAEENGLHESLQRGKEPQECNQQETHQEADISKPEMCPNSSENACLDTSESACLDPSEIACMDPSEHTSDEEEISHNCRKKRLLLINTEESNVREACHHLQESVSSPSTSETTLETEQAWYCHTQPVRRPPSNAEDRPLKNEREALLIGIISTFLHVHPYGASMDYICSYLQQLDQKVCQQEIQNLLSSNHRLFQSELSGTGATLAARWKFCGFQQLPLT